MSETIERVAQAIVEKINDIDGMGRPWEEGTDLEKDEARAIARAAIQAMREPSEAMQRAGLLALDTECDCDQMDCWHNMIDEALK